MSVNREVNKTEYEYLNKMFMGVVEDINDPRKEGRCKIRVISIHEDLIPTEDLPWAYPSQKSNIFGAAGAAGSISIPKKGAIVIVKFNNGNIYSPEYISIHELAQDVKDELSSEYEGSHILLFDGDQELKIWFAPSKGITISLKGASINLAPDNTVTLKTENKVVVDAKRVELGQGAAESLIKGDTFLNLFNTHAHPSAGAPPAVPISSAAVLSKFIKTK